MPTASTTPPCDSTCGQVRGYQQGAQRRRSDESSYEGAGKVDDRSERRAVAEGPPRSRRAPRRFTRRWPAWRRPPLSPWNGWEVLYSPAAGARGRCRSGSTVAGGTTEVPFDPIFDPDGLAATQVHFEPRNEALGPDEKLPRVKLKKALRGVLSMSKMGPPCKQPPAVVQAPRGWQGRAQEGRRGGNDNGTVTAAGRRQQLPRQWASAPARAKGEGKGGGKKTMDDEDDEDDDSEDDDDDEEDYGELDEDGNMVAVNKEEKRRQRKAEKAAKKQREHDSQVVLGMPQEPGDPGYSAEDLAHSDLFSPAVFSEALPLDPLGGEHRVKPRTVLLLERSVRAPPPRPLPAPEQKKKHLSRRPARSSSSSRRSRRPVV